MKLPYIKNLSLVTAVLCVVTACTAEPQDKAAPQTPPVSEAMRDPVEPPAPSAIPTGLDAPPASATTERAVLAVEGEGIRFFNPVTTSATPIPFGRPRSEVLATLERVRGPAGMGTNEDCGAGPVQYASWADGLSLVFQRDRFVGWGLDGRAAGAISTAGGIGPGSTREALDGAYGNVEVRKTSLGNEFSAGGFFGLLDGPNANSKITDMWAGVNCVAH
ncbi:MAG: hypothetical protein ACXIUO_09110 [Erythrobacter sp.]